MRPQDLIPIDLPIETTPMGRRPVSQWIRQGAGGSPFEPTGWYPSRPGNLLAPGYDGVDVASLYESARGAALTVPGPPRVTSYASEASASAFAPARSATVTYSSQASVRADAPRLRVSSSTRNFRPLAVKTRRARGYFSAAPEPRRTEQQALPEQQPLPEIVSEPRAESSDTSWMSFALYGGVLGLAAAYLLR